MKGIGGTSTVPTITDAANTNNKITLDYAATNCAFGVGTVIKLTVLSAAKIRAEVTTIPLGDGGTGTITFGTA